MIRVLKWFCLLGALVPLSVVAAPNIEGALNINTATVDQFELLPGIGPAKAERIVKLRKKRRRFRRVYDLLRVRGIGRKTLRKLKKHLRVVGPTTLAVAKAGKPRSQVRK